MEFDRGTATMSRAFANRGEQSDATAPSKHHNGTTNGATAKSSSMNMHFKKSRFDISGVKEFKLQELAMLSLSPIVRSIQHWWLQRAERHYLICADVEQQRAREAQMNVAYYQKRAALARSARI
jgi:heme exporter protein D